MFYKKEGLPEEGELTVCTVKKILPHSVFVNLDEYENKEGMVHISEIAPGRIRTVRDYVREGKQIVCKVINIDLHKQHIDLSIRRVTTQLRINKLASYKQEDKAEKLLIAIGKKFNKTPKQIYDEVVSKAIEENGSLNEFFQNIVSEGKKVIESLNIDKKIEDLLFTTISEKIKPPEVIVKGEFTLTTYEPDGIDSIKKLLNAVTDPNAKLSYISAPKYRIEVKSTNYKTAESILKQVTDSILNSAKNLKIIAEFSKVG